METRVPILSRRDRVLLATVLGTLFAGPSVAAADPTKDACIAANESAQDLRQAGRLREARRNLVLCLVPSCPVLLRVDCAQQLKDVDAATPTIVFEVKDGAGNDLSDARVLIDGQPFAEIDGAAVPVDPGEHRFTFEVGGLLTAERTLILHEGDKGRHERVVLEVGLPSPATGTAGSLGGGAPQSSSTHGLAIPTLAYVALGVGAVGLSVGIGAGVASDNAYTSLKQECPAGCPPTEKGELDNFHRLRTWSYVGYVTTVAGVAGGAVLWLTLPRRSSDATATRLWIGPTSLGFAGGF